MSPTLIPATGAACSACDNRHRAIVVVAAASARLRSRDRKSPDVCAGLHTSATPSCPVMASLQPLKCYIADVLSLAFYWERQLVSILPWIATIFWQSVSNKYVWTFVLYGDNLKLEKIKAPHHTTHTHAHIPHTAIIIMMMMMMIEFLWRRN